jgi:hypothetical protein
MSFFAPIGGTPQQGKTHVCILCPNTRKGRFAARRNLSNKTNGAKHINESHKDIDWTKGFQLHGRPAAQQMSLLAALTAKPGLSNYRKARQVMRGKLLKPTAEMHQHIHDLLARLCFTRCLPYSFVEWPELIELLEDCAMLGPVKVRLLRDYLLDPNTVFSSSKLSVALPLQLGWTRLVGWCSRRLPPKLLKRCWLSGKVPFFCSLTASRPSVAIVSRFF